MWGSIAGWLRVRRPCSTKPASRRANRAAGAPSTTSWSTDGEVEQLAGLQLPGNVARPGGDAAYGV